VSDDVDVVVTVAPTPSATVVAAPRVSTTINRSGSRGVSVSRSASSARSIAIAPAAKNTVAIVPTSDVDVEIPGVTPVPITQAAIQGPKGDPGAQGPPGPAASSTLTAIAAIDISGERIVISQADGTLIYDDPTNLALSEAAAFITVSAGIAGSEISLITYGPVSASFWNWTPGAPIFLGLNGTLTQSVPALPNAVFLLQVGVAETPTMIFWDPQPSIVLA
jgi:hypothetical protein